MKKSTIFLIFILCFFVVLYVVLYFSTVSLKNDLNSVQHEIDKLKQENMQLSGEYLKLINPERIKKIAIDKLHMTEVKKFYVTQLEAE